MKFKTAKLTDAALDWAVATIEGLPIQHDPMGFKAGSEAGYWIWDETKGKLNATYQKIGRNYSPSRHWVQGGPIIDSLVRDGLRIHARKCRYASDATECTVDMNGHYVSYGPTLLIAAMRCYVASKLGEEVDVPQELLGAATHAPVMVDSLPGDEDGDNTDDTHPAP